jgi:hypothetical protein
MAAGMRLVIVIHLFLLKILAHARATTSPETVQGLMDRLVSKLADALFSRLLEASFLEHPTLDQMMLGNSTDWRIGASSLTHAELDPTMLGISILPRLHLLRPRLPSKAPLSLLSHPHSFRPRFSSHAAFWTKAQRDTVETQASLEQQDLEGAAKTSDVNLRQQPADVGELVQLSVALIRLPPTRLAIAQLTDAVDYPVERPSDDPTSAIQRIASSLKRLRRSQLLIDMLKADRTAYIDTVSFLNIPRAELPNRQDVPLRACDPDPRRPDPAPKEDAVDGIATDDLVPDCILQDKAMGENLAEAWLLEVTRNIYAEETGLNRNQENSIRGLLEEMRNYMLSEKGMKPLAQQGVLIRTLRRLMTPFLPPFYRIFMGGIVPSYDPNDKRVGANPKWLADGIQWVRNKLPVGKEYLEPGRQLGPWFYAPTLTAVVAPYAFGFLVGPSRLNFRSDGELGGLVVEKCKFLQESNCKGMCLNSCKLPAQQLFGELGLPLRVSPNFQTQECQWSFGEVAPPPEEDPTWPKGCLIGCTSREAMKELRAKCE